MVKYGEGNAKLTSEQSKSRGAMAGAAGDSRHLPPPYQYHYGTFGVPDYSQPAIGFPQPAPAPRFAADPAPSAPPYPLPPSLPPYPSGSEYYAQGYQAITGYAAFQEGGTVRILPRLPCWGLGIGWFLLFFLQLLYFWGSDIPYYYESLMNNHLGAGAVHDLALLIGVTEAK